MSVYLFVQFVVHTAWERYQHLEGSIYLDMAHNDLFRMPAYTNMHSFEDQDLSTREQ